MKAMDCEAESGYVDDRAPDDIHYGCGMHDVEVLRITGINVIARGSRYGRQWLLKGLRPELLDHEGLRRKLYKEFEIHSRLRHPGIVESIGFEEIEGLGLCIVEEWIDGDTLREALNSGGLSRRDKNRIMREVIAAVAYMHSRGVVHRDLKPSNIMLRSIGGEAVIIDLGLSDTADYVELKQPGGTPGYISPEQIESGGANPADDIYSLGVIMNELCPGFGALRRRCIGSAANRPEDGKALLKAFDHRRKRPRRIAAIAGIVAALILIAAGVTKILDLEQTARNAEMKVSSLSAKNERDNTLVTQLRDSLHKVGHRLKDTEETLNSVAAYDSLKQTRIKESQQLIDRLLKQEDAEVFSKIAPGDVVKFNEALRNLTAKQQQLTDSYYRRLSGDSLRPEDREAIKDLMINHLGVRGSEYVVKWQKRIIQPTYSVN